MYKIEIREAVEPKYDAKGKIKSGFNAAEAGCTHVAVVTVGEGKKATTMEFPDRGETNAFQQAIAWITQNYEEGTTESETADEEGTTESETTEETS